MKPLNIFIGFDKAEIAAYQVCAYSIIKNSSVPVSITPLNIRHMPWFTNNDYKASTEFAFTRFLVPYLSDYEGHSLFLDADMLVLADIVELFDHAEPNKVVSCVKHDYVVDSHDKFLGQEQTAYPKKNWSSVMLFNNRACGTLTPDYVNTAKGLDLHQFLWCGEDEIGVLPRAWNYLVGEEVERQMHPNIVHFTRGGPYFQQFEYCEFSPTWYNYWEESNCVLDKKVVRGHV